MNSNRKSYSWQRVNCSYEKGLYMRIERVESLEDVYKRQGLIGMGNNPMVGATVAVAVGIEEAAKAGKF